MPYEVLMKENIAARTFMEPFLDGDFFLTRSKQTFNVEVQFTDDVTEHRDMMVHHLTYMNGLKFPTLRATTLPKRRKLPVSDAKRRLHNLNILQDVALLNRSPTADSSNPTLPLVQRHQFSERHKAEYRDWSYVG